MKIAKNRESRRVRLKLEKLDPTLIFGKNQLPKLAKIKILVKTVFRRALNITNCPKHYT